MPRTAITALLGSVALAAALACGSPDERPQATGTIPTVEGDETGPIRNVISRQRVAIEDYNVDLSVEKTCTQFKDRERQAAAQLMPAMADIATPDQVADPAFAADLNERLRFVDGMYGDEADALVEAIRRNDQAAFERAAVNYVAKQTRVRDMQVEDIVVDGDSATAQVTLVIEQRNGESQTFTEKQTFVKEDGNWVECTPET
jgi:uncharacterized protein YchJ